VSHYDDATNTAHHFIGIFEMFFFLAMADYSILLLLSHAVLQPIIAASQKMLHIFQLAVTLPLVIFCLINPLFTAHQQLQSQPLLILILLSCHTLLCIDGLPLAAAITQCLVNPLTIDSCCCNETGNCLLLSKFIFS